jgi:hypothetical protein
MFIIRGSTKGIKESIELETGYVDREKVYYTFKLQEKKIYIKKKNVELFLLFERIAVTKKFLLKN